MPGWVTAVYFPYPNIPPQGRPVRVMLTGAQLPQYRSACVGGASACTGGWIRRAADLLFIEASQETLKYQLLSRVSRSFVLLPVFKSQGNGLSLCPLGTLPGHRICLWPDVLG